MATITRKNFPGVYTQIIDQSATATNTSRFKPGLIGVASKGPFDVATPVGTPQDFVRLFGQPVAGSFLGTALGIMAPFTNGAVVVRVGNRYSPLPSTGVSFAVTGTVGQSSFTTAGAPYVDSTVNALPAGASAYYVEVLQNGRQSLINAQVASVTFGTIVNLANGATLPDSYNGATMLFSPFANAASKAVSTLEGYVYSGAVSLGTVSGTKGAYNFNVTSNGTNLAVGSLITITQTGKYPTQEVYVSSVGPSIGGVAQVQLQPTNDTERGYQALALQDTYTAGTVQVAVGTTNAAVVYALTEGTWANTIAGVPTTGLQVRVGPGTSPGTKKLQVYSDSTLVEVFDNLGLFTSPSGALDFNTTINTTTPSSYVTINVFGTVVPANSVDPWNAAPTLPIVGAPTNTANPNNVPPTGAFFNGFNGENAQNTDYVGRYDPVNDVATGIKAFEDTDNVDINVVCAPGITSTDASFLGTQTQLRDTAKKTNAIGLIDVPYSFPQTGATVNTAGVPLNVWDAVDWHNGQGKFASHGQFNTPYLAAFWNWFTMADPITGKTILAPPTIGALRAMAFTWVHDQPWYVAAGDIRGVIDEATDITFKKLSDDAKETIDAPGNGLNPIIKQFGAIKVFGDRTMLRVPAGTTDKLTAIHNLVLVEFVLKGMSAIARTKVFDPNDLTLLQQLNLAMTQFLNGVQALRGIEAYQLVCDSSNNNATTRNNREVIVDLFVIPTDSVERIYINATVNQSGAFVNNVTG